MARITTGHIAEDKALELLQLKGLKLVERNFRSRFGEIDLVMEDGPTLVFIEVRFRASDRFGSAKESVTRQKQGRLLRTAACFLQARRINRPVRFDVAALTLSAQKMSMDWVKGAFDAG